MTVKTWNGLPQKESTPHYQRVASQQLIEALKGWLESLGERAADDLSHVSAHAISLTGKSYTVRVWRT